MLVIKHFGSFLGKIDHAIIFVWTTVVHTHDHRTAIGEIGHAGIARQRHRWMRSGQMCHVVDFTIGSQTTVKSFTIPRGMADLDVFLVFLGIIPATFDLVGLTGLIAPATTW